MGDAAAPADAAELHERYYAYICNLLRQRGIAEQDIEDTASDIETKLVERDVIAMFNPGYHIEHRGEQVQANFTTFLTNMVLLYTRGKRERLSKRNQREIPTDTWEESAGEHQLWDDYSLLAAQEWREQTRAILATIPRRSARDQCDLVALFDEMADMGIEDDHIDYAALQEKFHISATSVYQWVARLRDVLKAIRDGEITPLRPEPSWIIPYANVRLTATEIREVIELLNGQGKQPMVRQPLRKARHKLYLKANDPDWYHPFSKEERDQFPELEIDPETHRKPAGHVRNAVVHRLERMLAEAPIAHPAERIHGKDEVSGSTPDGGSVPQVPDAPADLLECELWKLGASPEKLDYIMGLAQQVFA